MTRASRSLRDNAFLVAAVSLPIAVVGFFLLATAIPRWTVPPPAYDLLLRAGGSPYDQARPHLDMEINVREGRVEVTVRPPTQNVYPQLSTLWLFNHKAMNVSQIPIDLPTTMAQTDPPRTIVIDAFGGRKVLGVVRAPDGYQLETRSSSGGGIIGDLFGMSRYDQKVSLVNRGRIVALDLPAPYGQYGLVYAVGWVLGEAH